MADTLRGDGLARVHRALDGLEADPLGLGRARMRFSQSPPPYTSNPSGTTTRSASPDARSDEQRRREQRRYQLIRERAASLPQEQFEAQVEEERKRIWHADPRTRMTQYRSIDTTFDEDARETVKNRWIEQGIWKNKWDDTADGKWKHEEPLELESGVTDTEAAPLPRPFSFALPQMPPQPNPKRKKDNGKRRIADRRAVREHEREASRPYHQFVYQISRERERIQDESRSVEGIGAGNADINTTAYENVKNTWTERGIWNKRWGILPGMSWKHEEPLEEETVDDTSPQANLVENGSHDVGEAPAIRIFGSPSTVESNHRQASGAMNTSQQGLSAGVDSVELGNGDAERSLSPPNLSRFRTGNRVLRPTTGQVSRPSKREPSNKVGLLLPIASTSLGPVHPSKISKATGKKRPAPQRQMQISKGISSGGLPLSSVVDVAKLPPSPASVSPRRSKRIQRLEPGMPNDTTEMASASTDSIRGITGSRPRRNVAVNPKSIDSTKPQGRISKRQRSNAVRGNLRKDDT